MKTYNEVLKMLEESIENHDLTKMKDAIMYCEDAIYSSVGFAGPLIYSAECDFSVGVEFLLGAYYHDVVMKPEQRDQIWSIALFGNHKAKSIVSILIEYNIIPSKHFLATLSSQIFREKELTRDSIIFSLKKELPEMEFCAYYHDTDRICIIKKQLQEENTDDSGTPE